MTGFAATHDPVIAFRNLSYVTFYQPPPRQSGRIIDLRINVGPFPLLTGH
jgi:hypothetical protein